MDHQITSTWISIKRGSLVVDAVTTPLDIFGREMVSSLIATSALTSSLKWGYFTQSMEETSGFVNYLDLSCWYLSIVGNRSLLPEANVA